MRKFLGRFDPRTWPWKRIKQWVSAFLVIAGFVAIFSGKGFLGVVLIFVPLALDWRAVRERSRTESEIKKLKFPTATSLLLEVANRRIKALETNSADRRLIAMLTEKVYDVSEKNQMLVSQYNFLEGQLRGVQEDIYSVGGRSGRSSIVAD